MSGYDAAVPDDDRTDAQLEDLDLALADPDLSLDSTPETRALKAQFVANFGVWFEGEVRPLLRRVHAAGGEPQLLVNDLADFLHTIAESIVFPVEDAGDGDDDEGDGADEATSGT